MDTFKINKFHERHPNEPFPWFRQLDSNEMRRIRDELCRLANLPNETDGLSLVIKLEQVGEVIARDDFEVTTFDIAKVLSANDLNPGTLILINWYRFDDIDEMRLSDFIMTFADLWHPGAEDPDIFDASLRWMLSIRHYRAFILRTLGTTSPATPR